MGAIRKLDSEILPEPFSRLYFSNLDEAAACLSTLHWLTTTILFPPPWEHEPIADMPPTLPAGWICQTPFFPNTSANFSSARAFASSTSTKRRLMSSLMPLMVCE